MPLSKPFSSTPEFAGAYTVLGMIHTAEKDFAHAEADYRQALKLNDRDSDAWFMLGRTLFLRDDFAEAVKAFNQALKINPQSVRSYENLARTKDVLGDLKGAEENYKEGLQRQPHPEPFRPGHLCCLRGVSPEAQSVDREPERRGRRFANRSSPCRTPLRIEQSRVSHGPPQGGGAGGRDRTQPWWA